MNNSILILFGQRIKELRTSKNWTQEQFAKECGLHKNYIGMVERGERNPSLINIEVISKGLDSTISDLLLYSVVRNFRTTEYSCRGLLVKWTYVQISKKI